MKWLLKVSLLSFLGFLWGVPGAWGEVLALSVTGDSDLTSTLKEALRIQEEGMDVTVTLAPGIYRTPLRLIGKTGPFDPSPGQLIVRAEFPGSVFFSEGIPLREWGADTFRTYRHTITWDSRNHRRHFLFFDGAWLSQEWVRERLDPWEYWISQEENALILAVPPGKVGSPDRVVVASRSSEPTLLIKNVINLTLEGLTFEYDFGAQGAVNYSTPQVVDSRQLIFRDCAFLRNQVGLRVLNSTSIAFHDCRFQFSAEQALLLSGCSDVELRNATLSHNGFLEPEARARLAFGYALVLRNLSGALTVKRSRISDNPAGIFIYDSLDAQVSLEDLVVGYHKDFGISIVGGDPEISLTRSRIGRNGEAGIYLDIQGGRNSASGLLKIKESIFFTERGGPLLTIENGRTILNTSILESRDPRRELFSLGSGGSLRGEDNLYYHTQNEDTAFNGLSFSDWRTDPAREKGGIFADPLFLDTEALDFDLSFESPWFQKAIIPE